MGKSFRKNREDWDGDFESHRSKYQNIQMKRKEAETRKSFAFASNSSNSFGTSQDYKERKNWR